MLRVNGKVHVAVTTTGVTVNLLTGEYTPETFPEGAAFDSREVTTIFFCNTQEAAEIMNSLHSATEQGRATMVPVPESAKEVLAVYEHFNERMTADSALGGTKKALELVEIWARGNHGPTERGTVTSDAARPGHSESVD